MVETLHKSQLVCSLYFARHSALIRHYVLPKSVYSFRETAQGTRSLFPNFTGVQSSPASTHSGEKQEIGADTHQPAVSSHLVQPHPLNNSGYQQSSLGRRNESYRKTHKNRMPHYSPERQLMESFSTDTSGYNNKMKSTGSNSNMA